MARREPHPGRIKHQPYRRQHAIVIEQWLALAHQHNVGARRQRFAMIFEQHQDLARNLRSRQIANQPQLRGKAEVAIHGATRLRRNANRLAAFRRHEHGFNACRARDARGRAGVPASGEHSIAGHSAVRHVD